MTIDLQSRECDCPKPDLVSDGRRFTCHRCTLPIPDAIAAPAAMLKMQRYFVAVHRSVKEQTAGETSVAAGFYSVQQACDRLGFSDTWVRRRKVQLEGRHSNGSTGRLSLPAEVIEEIVAGKRPMPTKEDRALPARKQAPRMRRSKGRDLLPVNGKP